MSPRSGAAKQITEDTVPCLLLPYESARFIILFFHSNAEDLGRCRWFCHFLRDQFQVHVLAVEYPGYGVCPGLTTRESVVGNALAALHFTLNSLKLPLERIKVFGRSIGTGPALALASRFRLAGTILVTPFTSVRGLFQDRLGPLAMLVDEWFENDKAIKEVTSPTIIIHGRNDQIVPVHHSEKLYKACMTRKLFINPAIMEHNTNLTTDISFLIVPMFRFFALPDYSFQEFTVPSWAFDKRRSALYVRPSVQVCSRGDAPPSSKGVVTSISLPSGDDDDLPPPTARTTEEHNLSLAQARLQGQLKSPSGDTPIVDYEKVTVLTQPTVRHCYNATKKRYDFRGLDEACGSADADYQQPCTALLDEMIEGLQRRPLGNHTSVSTPPVADVAGEIQSRNSSRANRKQGVEEVPPPDKGLIQPMRLCVNTTTDGLKKRSGPRIASY